MLLSVRSYGPQVGLHLTPERQELLQQQYGFKCACDSCAEGLHGRQLSSPARPAAPGKQHTAPAAWQQEAATVGLRCCSCDQQLSSESGSAGCVDGPCPGALVPATQLPVGNVSVQPLATAGYLLGSGSSSQQHAHCTVCGWVMPPNLLQQKLLALQAAAADAEAACRMKAELAEQQMPAQAQQRDRRLQQVRQALKLLQKATDVRQQHLAAGNHLLGQSHHATAVAAVEAAVLAAARASSSVGVDNSSKVTGSPANTLAQLLDSSLVILQTSLRMQTEEEVCSVLLRQQDMLQALQDSCAACTCASCSGLTGSVKAAEAVLQLSCSCSQHSSKEQRQQAQQADRQHSAQPPSAHLVADSSTMAHAGPAQAVLQESLSLAFLHFSKSAAVLARSHSADSLALAAEQAACCAAGLAFVAYSAPGGHGAAACSQRADEADGRAAHARVQLGQEGAQQGSCGGCCRCTNVLCDVAHVLQQVSATVPVHLGFTV